MELVLLELTTALLACLCHGWFLVEDEARVFWGNISLEDFPCELPSERIELGILFHLPLENILEPIFHVFHFGREDGAMVPMAKQAIGTVNDCTTHKGFFICHRSARVFI